MSTALRTGILLAVLFVHSACGSGSSDIQTDETDVSDLAVVEVPTGDMPDSGREDPAAGDGAAPDPLLPEWIVGKGQATFRALCPDSDILIAVLGEGIIRLLYTDDPAEASDHSYAVVEQDWGEPSLSYGHETGNDFFLQTKRMRLEVRKTAGQGRCGLKIVAGEGDPAQWTTILEDPAEGPAYVDDPGSGTQSIYRLTTDDAYEHRLSIPCSFFY